MKLEFIPLEKLVISRTNMRARTKAPDVSDILATVRSRGILQPLIVRPNCAPDGYEIVAGARRFTAAKIVADERRAALDEPPADADWQLVPCAILDAGDDAAAVEASLIENHARLDPDEVTQWEGFTRLVREGRRIEDIAATFGLPDLAVRRVLALGNLLPAIRELYRRQEIDAATVRHLTLASKSQQKAWLALVHDPESYVPSGHQLKAWLFGGQSIPARHALFDVEASGLATIADLFGDDRFFVDADAFWTAQNAAIAARREACLAQGWADAVIVPPTEHFSSWEYEKAGKRKGGRVYIDVRANGEVIVHEGYLSRKEAARLARTEGEAGGVSGHAAPARPEVTATLQGYLDLHRHAAVRAELAVRPAMALRLLVAHAIVGSHLWNLRVEPQSTRSDEVRESIETSHAEARFDEHRRAVLAVLGFDPDETTVVGGQGTGGSIASVWRRLLDLPDAVVLDIIAIVIGETLAVGSLVIEAVGIEIGLDMTRWWQADDAFFTLLRDREVLGCIVAEVAGQAVASANAGEKTKTLKAIIRDHLDGTNGRAAHGPWVPRWLTFPTSAYTPRGSAIIARQDWHDEPEPGGDDDEVDAAEPLASGTAYTANPAAPAAPEDDSEAGADDTGEADDNAEGPRAAA